MVFFSRKVEEKNEMGKLEKLGKGLTVGLHENTNKQKRENKNRGEWRSHCCQLLAHSYSPYEAMDNIMEFLYI